MTSHPFNVPLFMVVDATKVDRCASQCLNGALKRNAFCLDAFLSLSILASRSICMKDLGKWELQQEGDDGMASPCRTRSALLSQTILKLCRSCAKKPCVFFQFCCTMQPALWTTHTSMWCGLPIDGQLAIRGSFRLDSQNREQAF